MWTGLISDSETKPEADSELKRDGTEQGRIG